jgi:hypothetical protein
MSDKPPPKTIAAESLPGELGWWARHCPSAAEGLPEVLEEAAGTIVCLRDALDAIKRHCGENGETGADRGHRWAAEVARNALNGEPYAE